MSAILYLGKPISGLQQGLGGNTLAVKPQFRSQNPLVSASHCNPGICHIPYRSGRNMALLAGPARLNDRNFLHS
jgi:hypothetical protein